MKLFVDDNVLCIHTPSGHKKELGFILENINKDEKGKVIDTRYDYFLFDEYRGSVTTTDKEAIVLLTSTLKEEIDLLKQIEFE